MRLYSFILTLVIFLFLIAPVYSGIYYYVDGNGIHFSNVPISNKYKLYYKDTKHDKKNKQKNLKKRNEQVAKYQSILNEFGYKVGKLDGFLGKKTKVSIKSFQKNNNLKITGYFDTLTIAKLDDMKNDLSKKENYKITKKKCGDNHLNRNGCIDSNLFRDLPTTQIANLIKKISSLRYKEISKDDYETTEEFHKRLEDFNKNKSNLTKKILNDFYIINLPLKPIQSAGFDIRYSADDEVFYVKLKEILTIRDTTLSTGSYIGVNAFGVEVEIEKQKVTYEKLFLTDNEIDSYSFFKGFDDNSELDNFIQFDFKVALEIAKKENLTAYILYRVCEPFNFYHNIEKLGKPTINDPAERVQELWGLGVELINVAILDDKKNLVFCKNLQ